MGTHSLDVSARRESFVTSAGENDRTYSLVRIERSCALGDLCHKCRSQGIELLWPVKCDDPNRTPDLAQDARVAVGQGREVCGREAGDHVWWDQG